MRLSSLAGSVAGLLLAACQPPNDGPRACTQMWCAEGLTASFGQEPWPAGTYSFEVLADDRRTTCRATLPLAECQAPSASCEDPAVRVLSTGCALPPAAQGFHGLHLSQIPDTIVIRIEGPPGRTETRSKVHRQCSFPNGEGCDPRPCCGAEVDAKLTWRR